MGKLGKFHHCCHCCHIAPASKKPYFKGILQICGSSGSNFVKNKKIWNATWGLAPE